MNEAAPAGRGQYGRFFAQLDDEQFSGIHKSVIIRGTVALIFAALVFFFFFGAVIWLLFHLLPFIIAFVALIFLTGAIYSACTWVYETFMKGKS